MARASELPSFSVRRPTAVVVMNLLIVIAGLGALFGIEVRELPDVDRPVVTVRAFFDGASPETMDAEVTSVVEGAVARVSGIRAINSASEENNMRVAVVARTAKNTCRVPTTAAASGFMPSERPMLASRLPSRDGHGMRCPLRWIRLFRPCSSSFASISAER